jgi:hypothetical protein
VSAPHHGTCVPGAAGSWYVLHPKASRNHASCFLFRAKQCLRIGDDCVPITVGSKRYHRLTIAAGSHICQRIELLLQDGRRFSRGLTRRGWTAVILCGIPIYRRRQSWIVSRLNCGSQPHAGRSRHRHWPAQRGLQRPPKRARRSRRPWFNWRGPRRPNFGRCPTSVCSSIRLRAIEQAGIAVVQVERCAGRGPRGRPR